MNVARFIAFRGKLEYGRSGCIFAYISMTTRARDFKFAGTPVQRLQLAMVTLTQKSFSAQYALFSRGGSQIVRQNVCEKIGNIVEVKIGTGSPGMFVQITTIVTILCTVYHIMSSQCTEMRIS